MSRSVTKSRRPNWRAALSRPIQVKAGPKLATLADVRAFVLTEPAHVMERPTWKLALAALLEAAENGGDIALATQRAEFALFMQARWLPPK